MLTSWVVRQRLTSVWKIQSMILARHALCAVALVLLVVGCGSESSQPGSQSNQALVGKWTGQCNIQNGAFKQIEFLADGTLIVEGVAGTYSFVDSQRVKLQTQFLAVIYSFSVSGDTLTLSDTQGKSCTLQRST